DTTSHHEARATVRDLRNRFARIVTWIEDGERGEDEQPRPGSRHPRPRAAQGAAGLVAGLPGQAANGLAPWTRGQIEPRADRRGAGRPSVTAYADSGVIARLYVLEPNSPEAARLVSFGRLCSIRRSTRSAAAA